MTDKSTAGVQTLPVSANNILTSLKAKLLQSTWTHKHRGTDYVIIGFACMQSTNSPIDNDLMVIYEGVLGSTQYVREFSEFMDGRFTRKH